MFSLIRVKFFISFLTLVLCLENIKDFIPDTSPEVQKQAVESLIKRTVGLKVAENFLITVDVAKTLRSFQISKTKDNKILITGSDGVSVSKGFHHYLKYYLRRDVSWLNNYVEYSEYPSNWPNVTIKSTSESAFIYYQNVCTWSYSFAWWSWSMWRKHIDWMAMMGISLTIAPVQEFIWNEVYLGLGLTENDINSHFAGPGFQAWQRMGNIRGWGGVLPSSYRQMQIRLQTKILKAQRELGISVALPAFAGHVPVDFAHLYPSVNFTSAARWNNFPDKYCCSLFLNPTDPFFRQISMQFLQIAISIYGTNHIYFADPFNEMQPSKLDKHFLNGIADFTYQSMSSVDAKAVWLLQGWMFIDPFWTDELVEAFVTAVPQGMLLILDLQSEQFPQYERTKSYYGQPFIWCMLHNFGGTLGMHGSANIINTRINSARNMPNSTLIGVGITPEGINQNYAMYALTLERAWLKDNLNLSVWFADYASIRYGTDDYKPRLVWQKILETVYSYEGILRIHGHYAVARRPATNLKSWIWYNATVFNEAWELLLLAKDVIPKSNCIQYDYDLVDLTRQYLQNQFDHIYINLMSAYRRKQKDRFGYIAVILKDLFNDLEEILASNDYFLLGRWLESAKRLAQNSNEERQFEFNARNQITIWGPNGEIVDYATKQWSGMVKDYFKPRWGLFINMLADALDNKTKFNGTAFKQIVFNAIEKPFGLQSNLYPIKSKGNTFQISQKIFNKWTNLQKNSTYINWLPLKVKFLI